MSSDIERKAEAGVSRTAGPSAVPRPRLCAIYLRGERVTEIRGGADIVSRSLLRMLRRYFSDRVEEFYLDEAHGKAPGRAEIAFSAMKGLFLPYGKSESMLLKEKSHNADFLFVDQSVYALACEDAEKANPEIRTAVLFHNVEREFYFARAIKKLRAHNLLLLPAITRAEKAAVRCGDMLVVLSGRDSDKIEHLYGRVPDFVMPVVLDDEFDRESAIDSLPSPDKFKVHEKRDSAVKPGSKGKAWLSMLFVGSAFPPNLQGVRWFVKKVLPSIEGTLTVVGRGFERYASELSGPKTKIVGAVETTAPWYREADCVVSPIFWGGGMKVKTAEAFMHGKTVIGTKEAFAGYDFEATGGMLANNVSEFVATLKTLGDLKNRESIKFSSIARSYYEKQLSLSAQYDRFAEALDSLFACNKTSRKGSDHVAEREGTKSRGIKT
jgi:hypothetical protein